MTLLWFVTIFLFIWNSILTFLYFRNLKTRHTLPVTISNSQFFFSLHRFNPFSDTGGEQSFVVSLLDRGGNGILLTSLHGRGITRIYAKKVNAGKADQELSAEERNALTEALASVKQHE